MVTLVLVLIKLNAEADRNPIQRAAVGIEGGEPLLVVPEVSG